ncbi:MFS family permease [Rhizobium sp. BK650]|uniref:MFS transporter n=1 Tax=Rhizobium sp. BK650 TaxID=2586990 RepID=UPI00160822A9|nr:MFS transporter [Rhizobium sp. BK650]MBB3656485.1 MFS family permease [Rhizobium sp. BK650]
MQANSSRSLVTYLVCFVGFTEAIIYGFSFPYYSLLLEQRGLSSTLIGMNAMLGSLGVLAVGPLVPGLIVRLGYAKFSIVAMLTAGVSFAAIAVVNDTWALFVYRTVLGTALAGLWISTEAWLNHVVDNRYRGLMNGIFQMGYSFGFFLGPCLIYVTDISTLWGPAAAASIALVTMAALSAFRDKGSSDFEEEDSVNWQVAWQARGLLLIAALVGIAETALYTLLPVFGIGIGLTHQVAVAILVTYTFGEVILTMPLGWLADRLDRRKLLAGCALVASVSVFAVSAVNPIPVAGWTGAFIAGGTVVGLYNLALVVVGETYKGKNLPLVSTAFSMAYSLGCAAGAAVGGAAMDLFGPQGLIVSIGLILIVFCIGAYFGLSGLGRQAAPTKAIAETL